VHVAAATKARPKLGTSDITEPTSSDYVVSEINTFIAIRDNLLIEAEASKTREQINLRARWWKRVSDHRGTRTRRNFFPKQTRFVNASVARQSSRELHSSNYRNLG